MTTIENGEKIRVFLVEDHEAMRRGLQTVLETEDDMHVVGEAATVGDALGRIAATRPDVAMLDLQLPDGNGVDLCREIRSRHPEIRVLLVSAFRDEEALFKALMAGASGYVLKTIRAEELRTGVRRVAHGESLLDPGATSALIDRMREGDGDELLRDLTERERDILALLAKGESNRDIAEHLFLSEKTIRNYVSRILRKLHVESRTQAAVLAVESRKSGGHWGSSRRNEEGSP